MGLLQQLSSEIQNQIITQFYYH